jgi:hypothetical protein
MLVWTMDSPEHERRGIEEYLRSQSGADFEIEHVEKLTSEYVMGREYDVWDAHTNEGRWWIITNPTNLYSQDAIKSMDVALSFHIGLMARVISGRRPRVSDAPESWILDVLRRLDVASASLDRAKEVEDFQAVGMRLREALVSLGEKLASLDVVDPAESESLKRGDFRGWAAVSASGLSPGSRGATVRGLLKANSEKTWDLVSWLTHARGATELDARLALAATSQVVEAFATVVARWRLGTLDRCPVCGSNQLTLDYSDGVWVGFCAVCGWDAPAEQVEPAAAETDADEEEPAAPPDGECIVIEDFGIYLTPQETRRMLEQAAELMGDEDVGWSNPFAFANEDRTLIDAHRMTFEASRGGAVAAGSELVYECDTDGCVNPDHAVARALPDSSPWTLGVVKRVRTHSTHVEMRVSVADGTDLSLCVDRAVLDIYGVGDASSLLERLAFASPPDSDGMLRFALGGRRVDYARASIVDARTGVGGESATNDPSPY